MSIKMKRAAVFTQLRLKEIGPIVLDAAAFVFLFLYFPEWKVLKEAREAISSPVDRLHGTFRCICH